MGVDKPNRESIFGKEFDVIVYPFEGQHKGHISILAHREDIKEIKRIIKINGKVK